MSSSTPCSGWHVVKHWKNAVPRYSSPSSIDLYSFGLARPGTLNLETIAERLPSGASLLNSVITLYDGNHNLIARNDNYFGSDVGPAWEATRADNPHIHYHSNRRGYIACSASPRQMRADFKVIDRVTVADMPVHVAGSLVVEAGRPGGNTD